MSNKPEQKVVAINSRVGKITQVVNQFFGNEVSKRREIRKRQKMIGLVKDFWVRSVLEPSIFQSRFIELEKQIVDDAFENQWRMILKPPGDNQKHRLTRASITEIFEEAHQSLLILGEAGSGKTITLLQLARDAIEQAELDPSNPIPVVFNLSSWTNESIEEWLTNELNMRYYIPKRVARAWVQNDELMLLMDGLDEVKPRQRVDCIKAINQFRLAHLCPMGLCSRTPLYHSILARLKFHGVVILQPLSEMKIEGYLGEFGDRFTELRDIIKNDVSLQDLAQTPLMLKVMMETWQEASSQVLENKGSASSYKSHLLNTYFYTMFERSRLAKTYTKSQTWYWIAFLASQMSKHGQPLFLLEQLQPSWLPSRYAFWVYVMITRLVGGLIVGICTVQLYRFFLDRTFSLQLASMISESNPFASLYLWSTAKEFWLPPVGFVGFDYGRLGLTLGFSNGVAVGLLDGISAERKGDSSLAPRPHTDFLPILKNMAILAIVGWIAFILSGIDINRLSISTSLTVGGSESVLLGERFNPILFPLINSMLLALILGIRRSQQSTNSDIFITEIFSLSWKGAILGGGSGYILGYCTEVLSNYGDGTAAAKIIAIFLGLFFTLVGLIMGRRSFVPDVSRIRPNQGIYTSLKNSILAGFFLGLITITSISGLYLFSVGLPSTLLGLFGELWQVCNLSLNLILAVAALGSLWFGGLDVIQHYVLRYLLAKSGYTPYKYVRFLDAAAEGGLLRKIGGQYGFVHPFFKEHFSQK